LFLVEPGGERMKGGVLSKDTEQMQRRMI